jgi:deazaflavin-dependent oxidoreductase (nitroreductase family)
VSFARRWIVSSGLRKVGLACLGFVGLLGVASAGLWVTLRYRPKPLVDRARRLFGRVLNPFMLRLVDRFDLDQPLVYHRGRKSGREYATPLCMSSTPEGFIVPAAFGPDVDWLANLRATPATKLVYERRTYPVVAEVIDLEQAIHYSGGTPGCPCWTTFKVEELVLLRPDSSRSTEPGEGSPPPSE